MSEEPFVMLSLKDDKAKKLAHALTNKSANKILTYLANHEGASEAEIAKALNLPISTVNYTMKVLVEAKLAVADEYSYSKKGREVNHYKLAKKYIIIAPDDEKESFFDRMKKLLPAATIAVAGAGIVRLWQVLGTNAGLTGAEPEMARSMAMESDSAQAFAAPTAEQSTSFFAGLSWFEPFLLGVAVVLILTMLVDYVRKKQ